MKKTTKPKIYKYNDTVVFLKDLFNFLKAKENKSLRDFADELKIATGLMPMILSRKRNLTNKLLKKIMKKFKYNKAEAGFAENLRIIGFSQKYEQRKKAIYQINKLKSYREQNKSEFEIYKYLSHWYYVAIKEMSELSDFTEEPAWIQKRLAYAVSRKEIEAALVFLKRTKILVYQKQRLVSSNKIMNCEEGIFKLTLGGFHKQILQLAGQSIDEVDRDKRRILGQTLKVDKNQLAIIHALLADTFEKIKAMTAQTNENEDVYHIELVSIPLTKKEIK